MWSKRGWEDGKRVSTFKPYTWARIFKKGNKSKEIDDSKFYKNSVQKARVKFENTFVNSEIASKGNGLLSVLHKIENNNPRTLNRFIYQLKNKYIGEILNLSPKKKNIDDRKVDKALLKTNYMIAFSKFGYLFLIDNYYVTIRKEIKEPDSPTGGHLMINNQFQSNQVGTYYVCNANSKSIFNIFSLKTDYSETLIGALLPFPSMELKELHHNLTASGTRIGNEQVRVSSDTKNYNPNADLFNDISEISKVIKWIEHV